MSQRPAKGQLYLYLTMTEGRAGSGYRSSAPPAARSPVLKRGVIPLLPYCHMPRGEGVSDGPTDASCSKYDRVLLSLVYGTLSDRENGHCKTAGKPAHVRRIWIWYWRATSPRFLYWPAGKKKKKNWQASKMEWRNCGGTYIRCLFTLRQEDTPVWSLPHVCDV